MVCNGNSVTYDEDGNMVNCPGCYACRGRDVPPPQTIDDDDDEDDED